MNIAGKHFTSIWYEPDTDQVFYIDQTKLPWELSIKEMKNYGDGVVAIADMEVRGAPLIGVAAAFALYTGLRGYEKEVRREELKLPEITGWNAILYDHYEELEGSQNVPLEHYADVIREIARLLIETRPTAVNLAFVVQNILDALDLPSEEWCDNFVKSGVPSPPGGGEPGELYSRRVLRMALAVRSAEIQSSLTIAEKGLAIIKEMADRHPGRPVNILTHCNAGWLAAVDYGTALAPVYLAHDSGIPVHVWVDETRPRNQGARLTVYELTQHGVPNTLIVDNAGGHLMQLGMVDMVIVGADRITANGDVVNKIGTYLKALAAYDNQVPFYVAAPASTFDAQTPSGKEVIIEERSADEVLFIGDSKDRVAPEGTRVMNPGFDITPARLVTGYITEGRH
jgi:methylthioribose-1-phosphate isomerase